MRRTALGLLAFFCLTRGAEAGPEAPDTLALPWHASTLRTLVGERVVLRAAAAVPGPDARLVGPSPGAAGPIEVVRSEPAPAGPDSAAWLLEVALFEVGDVDLSGLPFRVDAGDSSTPASLVDARIQVETTLADTAGAEDLRDLKGPVPVPLGWRWGRLLGAALVLAAAVAAIVWWRRRASRAPEPIAVVVPKRSPEEVALTALRVLEHESLPARGLLKEHYFRISGILRRYVEDRFGIPAVESTTGEIRDALTGSVATSVGEAPALLDILEESDLVKFAKVDPGPEAAGEALVRSRTWIERRSGPAPAPEESREVR